jgi:DnaA family protein
MSEQLTLDLPLSKSPSFESFVARGNEHLLQQLRAWCRPGEAPFIYLWGAAGSGKSHLLEAATRCSEGLYLRPPFDAEAARLEPFPRHLCLDDIDRACGQPGQEKALFELFNRARAEQGQLLVAARQATRDLPLQLEDLRSRLGWGASHRIQPLDDDGLLLFLTRQSADLGMELPTATAHYLLQHCERDGGQLQRLLQRLDKESLRARRRLTIPFVKQFIGPPGC